MPPCGWGLASVDCHGECVADRGSAEPEAAEALDSGPDEIAVGRGRRGHLRLAREGDQRDAHARRHPVEELQHGRLRSGEPRRLDVGRVHRAGDVDHEDHRRLVRRDEHRSMRARDRKAERGERREREQRREVPAEGARRGDRREDVEVREGHRVPDRAAVEPEVERDRERQHEQREQQQRMAERHARSGAGKAGTCAPLSPPSSLRLIIGHLRRRPRPGRCPGRGGPGCRRRPASRLRRPWTTRLATSAGPGGAGVPNPRARYQATSRSPALHVTTIESVDRHPPRHHAPRRRVAGRRDLAHAGRCPLSRRRSPERSPRAAGRSGARAWRPTYEATKTIVREVVTPGPTGLPEEPRKETSIAGRSAPRRCRRRRSPSGR